MNVILVFHSAECHSSEFQSANYIRLNVILVFHSAECNSSEFHSANFILLNFILLSVILLRVFAVCDSAEC
jgi:hypothetical protein